MKRQISFVSLVLAAMLIAGCHTTPVGMQSWEYHVEIVHTVDPHSAGLQARLNQLGKEGWILDHLTEDPGQFRVVMRRPLR